MAATLKALQARKLLAAETEWAIAKKALDEAERKRAKERARCRPMILAGELMTVGGIEIKVTSCAGSRSFSLKSYLEKHRLTKAMEPFVGQGAAYDRWTVRRTVANKIGKQ
jgi:hypothetical protein